MSKLEDPTYDPYAEVLSILSDPSTIQANLSKLQQLSTNMDTIAGQNVEQNQNEINEYLGNLRESEEILIDYLAYIQEIRTDLKECKKMLGEKQRDIKSIWLSGIYNGTIVKGFEEFDEIIENLYSVDLLIKEKMYMRASEVIRENIKSIDSADFNYLPVSQRVKEAYTKKMRKLSDQIMAELKAYLLLKHNSFEIELKKYAVVGMLNIPYLLSEIEEEEQNDSQTSIPVLIDALASIDQLSRIENLSMWDFQSDLQDLNKKCFAQFPTIPLEEETKASYTIASIIVSQSSKETALKVINSVIAVAALVIKNHFLLKQSLNKYKYTFSMGGLWEKVQKEIIDVFRTISKIPESNRESVAVDILNVEEKDSTYFSLLSSILELSYFHFPYLFNPVTTYLEQFHSAIQDGNLFQWVENFTLQFLEFLKNDTCKMFSACMSSNDAFRVVKSSDPSFLSCFVLLQDFEILYSVKNALPENYTFYFVEIAINILGLFMKELNTIMDKQTKDSKFFTLFLEDEEIFQELRQEPLFSQVSLMIPPLFQTSFFKLLGRQAQKTGKLLETEKLYLNFNSVGKSEFIGESAKLSFFANLINNLESVYESLLKVLDDVLGLIFEESEENKVQDEKIAKVLKKNSALRKLTTKLKDGLKRNRRISHKFYLESRLSAEQIKLSDEEISNTLKEHLISFHRFHDLSLFLLRGEIRMRIYSFLSHIKGRNYWDGEEHTDAEWFIGHLSREMVLVQLAIKHVMPSKKLLFVWENALNIMTEMLITGIGEIKDLSMSKQGLATYIKNVKVLQTELLQIEIVRFT